MFGFSINPVKATQAAVILLKLNNKKLNYTVLIKLLYLSDRQTLKEWNRPIVGGKYVSMDNGPVLSEVYDWIKGEINDEYWNGAIKKDNFDLVLKKDVGDNELSKAEIEVLTSIDKEYKDKTFGEMIDYCHDNIKEWAAPDGASLPISTEHILRVLGKTDEEINKIEEETSKTKYARRVFGVK